MISGFDTALSEVTLVLFTTLAPSGAVALVLVAAVLLLSKFESAMRARISTFMCIPLVVTMVGLAQKGIMVDYPTSGANRLQLSFERSRQCGGIVGMQRPVLAVFVFRQASRMVAAAAAGVDRGNGRRVRDDGVPCIFR